MADYQAWKNQTLGNRIDIDSSGDFDCVDMAKSWAVFHYGNWVSTIGYGNAKDLYNGASDAYFEKIPNNPDDPNQLPIQGDILVFNATPQAGYQNQYNNPYGHTGVLESCDHNGYTLIAQSSFTGLPAKLQYNTWRYRPCIGWLRPKDLTPPPAPDPFTLTDIAPKQVTINRQTSRWNMGYSDLDQMKANPVESLGLGAGPYTVTVLCHQNTSGYDYYLENRNNLGGFNIYDCAEYFPPAVVVPEELPPPPKVWPMPPATAPDTTPYTVVKLIDGYDTSNKAANHIAPAVAPVGAGQYYVFNKRFKDSDPGKLVALNITQNLGQPGYWINPDDNVPDVIPEPEVIPEPPKLPPPLPTDWSYHPLPVEVPVPTPTPELTPKGNVVNPNWKSSYKPFTDATGQANPVWYIAQKTFAIHDLATQRPDAMVTDDQRILIAGQFVGPDDMIYGRPQEALYDKAGNIRFWYYGCPLDREHVLTELESHRLYDTTLTKIEKQALKVIHDVEHLNVREARRLRQNSLKLEDQIVHGLNQVEQTIGKFMDIITRRNKR